MDVVVKVFGFDACSQFPLPSSEWGKIFVIFGVDNSLSIHAHNIKKYILILGEGLTNGLDTVIMTETFCMLLT